MKMIISINKSIISKTVYLQKYIHSAYLHILHAQLKTMCDIHLILYFNGAYITRRTCINRIPQNEQNWTFFAYSFAFDFNSTVK